MIDEAPVSTRCASALVTSPVFCKALLVYKSETVLQGRETAAVAQRLQANHGFNGLTVRRRSMQLVLEEAPQGA